jgi:hypothetical protein
VNPVPLAFKDQRNTLGHDRRAVFADCNAVLKVCNAPGLRSGETRAQKYHAGNQSNGSSDFQITELPNFSITNCDS